MFSITLVLWRFMLADWNMTEGFHTKSVTNFKLLINRCFLLGRKWCAMMLKTFLANFKDIFKLPASSSCKKTVIKSNSLRIYLRDFSYNFKAARYCKNSSEWYIIKKPKIIKRKDFTWQITTLVLLKVC